MTPENRYSNRTGPREASAKVYADVDIPYPGCWRIVLRRGAPASGIRIWLGHPLDPATGEEMLERPFHWQCELNGARVDLHDYWPGCAREAITREQYDRMVERNATQDEESPFYDPRRPIDLGSAPLPF